MMSCSSKRMLLGCPRWLNFPVCSSGLLSLPWHVGRINKPARQRPKVIRALKPDHGNNG